MMSPIGTELTQNSVRCSVVIGWKADFEQAALVISCVRGKALR
jgi:hypothetical protein